MSTLSCEKVRSELYDIEIISLKNAVEIKLSKVPLETSSGSISVHNGIGFLPTHWYSGSITSSTVAVIETVGYRFFIKDGFLKCVKKQISHHSLVANYITLNGFPHYVAQKKDIRESFYHPICILDTIQGQTARQLILDRIVDLALRKGIKVPDAFLIGSGYHHRPLTAYANPYLIALDWLAYPIIREINSPTVCKNLTNPIRSLIAPRFDPMNLKSLVEFHYGTSTSKMVSEIWDSLVKGEEIVTHDFDPKFKDLFLSHHKDGVFDEVADSNAIEKGDRHIDAFAFNAGPAIFKTMGFDYFYQAVKMTRANQLHVHPYTPQAQLCFNLTALLKHVTPKKMLSILQRESGEVINKFEVLQDTAQMFRQYDSADKIPKHLRGQYPDGLVVDFKFKSLTELHDKISARHTAIKSEENKKEIPVSPTYRKLHGMQSNNLRLVVPDNTTYLALWGKDLSICVASYGDRAARGDVLLLGVEKENQIKYCIEFCCTRVMIHRMSESFYSKPFDPVFGPDVDVKIDTVEETLPIVTSAYMGILPPDVSDEEGMYYTLDMIQFRGLRNGTPDKDDRIAVENMLAQWTKDNFEELSKIPGVIGADKRLSSNWQNEVNINVNGAVLNEGVINHAAQVAMNQGYQNQQIMVNHQAYYGLQNIAQANGNNNLNVD